tara:strand:- start:472 stop:615 length:144 start_codon:yes stop_codon:yes gene_type:complete
MKKLQKSFLIEKEFQKENLLDKTTKEKLFNFSKELGLSDLLRLQRNQ